MMNLNVPSKFIIPCSLFSFLVRVEGLEPPCLAASDPKSDTSTNFATPAFRTCSGSYCLMFEAVILRFQLITLNF